MYYKGKTDKGGTVVCNTAEQKRMLERIAGKIQWEAEAVIPEPVNQGELDADTDAAVAALAEAAIRKAGETQTGAGDAEAADTAAASGNSDLAGAESRPPVDPQPQETPAPEAPRPENGNGGSRHRQDKKRR